MAVILIADDDRDICTALKIYLSGTEHEVLEAHNGKQALDIVTRRSVDLVLMDIMMPGMDGIEATRHIREFSNIPVILLTAKSEDTDKINGLDIGADDYVTKPFNPEELIARINSQLRRYMKLGGADRKPDQLTIGSIVLDDTSKIVTVDGETVPLTPMEYGIIKLLMENPGVVFSSAEIYEKVWKGHPIGNENTVAVHIRHLREKIEIDPSNPKYIKVVWGHGYKMEGVNGTRTDQAVL
ncbi:MAG: response regulator transcription factor [Solobacterium sp.]|nr:response regulator transcription factor [Solobacterium sp.]